MTESQLRVQQWRERVWSSTSDPPIVDPDRTGSPTAFDRIGSSTSDGSDDPSEMEHLFERGVRRTRNHVATIGSESSGRDPEAHTIADESHRESEIATIESEAEAEEEENETSAELLREQEEAEKHKQEELKKLEKELKELADQLQNPSLSPEERDEIRQKISAVLGKIDAIRPANRQQQGEPHRQPQSSGQQTGGAQPSRGSHAPAGGGTGAGLGRGRESPVGGGANSQELPEIVACL